MAIAQGHVEHPLRALADGAHCTWFLPAADGPSAWKRWIAGSLAPQGVFTVDRGAASALRGGRSLLPAGVRVVDGTFQRGDPVLVRGPDGEALARGLSAYASEDAARIAYRELTRWMAAEYGFDEIDAYMLLSQAGRIRLGNMVDPKYTLGASILKKYLVV